MSASDKKKLRKEQRAAAVTERQKQEKKEAKKLKIYTLTFAVVMVLVVAIVVGVVVGPMIEGAIMNNTPAISVGEYNISSVEMNYFYIDTVSEHYNNVYSQYYQTWGNYWTVMLGFEPTKALNKQNYDSDTGKTWADHFVEESISNARDTYSLYTEALAKGYKLPEDEQKDVDSYLSSLDLYAKYNGFETVDGYLRNTYGTGANEGNYKSYYQICALANSYLAKYRDDLKYEGDDYRAYEKDKFDDYSTASYVHYTIRYTSYLGEGKKDDKGNTTWTDAEKETARQAMKADLEKILGDEIKDKETFDKTIQALTVNQVDKDGKPLADDKKPTTTEVKKAFYNTITLHVDALEWMKNTETKAGEIKAFDVYTYAEHEDPEHEHDDDCGCTRTTDGYTIVLFNGRDDNNVNMVNVRHILVKFTGGTKNESGETVYSQAEKDKAKAEAEKLLQQWKDGKANEESFGELANKESDDQNGKVTNGGLYEDIYPGQMVENFENWCFEEGRKTGDTGIVETEYGYHVMYYSSTDEMTYRDSLIDADLRVEDTEKWLEELVKDTPYTEMNLSKLNYGYIMQK